MSIQTSTSAAIEKRVANKSYVLAFTVMSASLMAGLSMTSMSAQAAGLGELFNNSNTKSKFLPVDEAFQVVSSTKATSKGTRLSINFDITPGHYVYKNKLTLNFPKGVSATPFTFSQSPVSIDDPTFGKVPVFTQRNMVATTMLTTKNGKGAKNVPVVIGWQGCATAGLCYPPEKVKTTVDIAVR
ncbi:protein-disulfide reductase DsbD N-terminal domain-containing protein [Psychrobacter sp. SZ93C1]|uniref:protein-disulfide reductase DsbD N-terminal domain-containing protein n=1 Tax=Psychrobacter sp. SZ93C1 TaxID=2792058 RepID=UPI0018CCADC7|nr:protein-disulfide reductase DsbD N-terminal domain-containing protein [Psychrobacter sp. SZ93C1]MBH0063938.1 protein-disulfide reductase DsbD N-terminal domain-containing protein [Psychrobacter sp. SZ93C1]